MKGTEAPFSHVQIVFLSSPRDPVLLRERGDKEGAGAVDHLEHPCL